MGLDGSLGDINDFHNTWRVTFSQTEDMISNAKALKKYRDAIFQRFDKHTGKKRNYWAKKLKESGNVDLCLTARKAKQEGIADHIGIPRMKVQISLDVTIE